MNFKFIKSGVWPKDFPSEPAHEVAFLGRSNAGKSSFINSLCGSSVAQVSKAPGKTRLINFFQGPGSLRIVDTPGYGYAKRSPSEQKMWKKMIEGYLMERPCLVALYLIMDVRREWSEEEQMIADLALSQGYDFSLILTKIDKINQKESYAIRKRNENLQSLFTIFYVSNHNRKGLDLIQEHIKKYIQVRIKR